MESLSALAFFLVYGLGFFWADRVGGNCGWEI